MVAGVPYSGWGNEGERFASLLKGKYTERALRGKLFTLSLAATTTGVAAGHITGAAAAAVTQFALWNPVGSGKNIALLQLWSGPISGTPAGGVRSSTIWAAQPQPSRAQFLPTRTKRARCSRWHAGRYPLRDRL
jgi:hypothetical protein